MPSSFLRPVVVALAWAGAVLCLSAVPAVAQLNTGKAKHIQFEASIAPSDPFSDLNGVSPPAGAKMTVQRGDTFVLTIKATPEEGWYTYPVTKRAPNQDLRQLTSVKFESEHFAPLYPITESEPEWKDYRKDL